MSDLVRTNYQIHGKARLKALSDFKKQLKKWGLNMPKVKPQVLDLGSGIFKKTGLIEYWVCNEQNAGYYGKFLFKFDGQT